MPSAYTEKVLEGCSFEDFILLCTRAFDASMRDEPLSTGVRKKFEPSDYHIKIQKRLEEELSQLKGKTKEELWKRYFSGFEKTLEDKKEYYRRNKEVFQLCDKMIKEVQAWTPPSGQHTPLKEFMLRQLTETQSFDGQYEAYEKEIENLEKRREIFSMEFVDKMFAEEVERMETSIEYHKQQYAEEVERVRDIKDWYDTLRKSIPQETTLLSKEEIQKQQDDIPTTRLGK